MESADNTHLNLVIVGKLVSSQIVFQLEELMKISKFYIGSSKLFIQIFQAKFLLFLQLLHCCTSSKCVCWKCQFLFFKAVRKILNVSHYFNIRILFQEVRHFVMNCIATFEAIRIKKLAQKAININYLMRKFR